MKHAITLSLLIFIFCAALAQAPQGINYQAAARNSQGNLLLNQPIGLRFSIRNGSITGAIIYRETQTATTDAFGTFSTVIGNGTPVQGTFAGIQWSTGSKFMQVEMDITGGTNYTDMGTTQLMSVPYALYADSAGNTGATGPTGPTGPSGGPIGPTGAVGPPSFDPAHSDGTDSITGIHLALAPDSTYTVPAGKNLHAYIMSIVTFPAGSWAFPIINGDTIADNPLRLILPAGTVIGNFNLNTPANLPISGYIAPAQYPTLFQNITSTPYTVPTGKTLFLTELIGPTDPNDASYYIDGVRVNIPGYLGNNLLEPYIVINGGSVISVVTTANDRVYINGILK